MWSFAECKNCLYTIQVEVTLIGLQLDEQRRFTKDEKYSNEIYVKTVEKYYGFTSVLL